ncbi:hypothetical protein N7481_001060 [Penicillium waksmanii]|uniref:uncharacterized protein n=1 Tax=Penicillium waksmanii TaxID=69791 RepID=UPI0025493A5A|nr:uncharacterized protein N7481_001060 [Penicillium waksmanii]KAJ6000651.1 hypothetical protein N7481_001060 [Penicillium waksmanii]
MPQQDAAAERSSKPEPVSESKAPGPGTDDEPLSSDEDELPVDSDELPAHEDRFKERTLMEKLNAPSSPAPVRSGAFSSQSRAGSTRKNPLRRTSSMMAGDDDDQEEIFSSWRSSQNKRLKTKTYPTTSFSKVPSSSARSAASPPDNRFKVPSTFSKKSPSAEENDTSEQSELTELSESEAESKPAMEIDQPTSDNDHVAVSSDFIVPPLHPDSKSSFETTLSKDNEAMALDPSGGSGSSSPLSSAPSDFIDLLEDETNMKPPAPRRWLCPMCKEEVDPDLLILFESQPNQRVRDQQQFCTSHKQNTAKAEWQEQGYPEINWETFDQRIKKFFPKLEKVLAPEHPSYYHNILSTIMKDGKAQNFRLTMAGDGIETISCGYYGTKGAAKMLQAVVDRFSATLRRLSASDNIIKTAGVAGYAQSVLVPELALCLVKEDMRVDDDAARKILRDSIDLGQKLNPALDDEVPVPAEDEIL